MLRLHYNCLPSFSVAARACDGHSDVMTDDALSRIANALDRLSPAKPQPADPGAAAYVWNGQSLIALEHFSPLPIALLTGIESQKEAVMTNGRRLAAGHSAHDVLLWGARGSGKSAIVKSSVAALQHDGLPLALIEAPADRIDTLGALFNAVRDWQTAVILFLDDLAFEGADEAARLLRSVLEGGAAARPDHVRIYVTSNRRHIVARSMAEQDDPINVRDVVDDRLALADRFGLSLGFHKCSQDDYLKMVAGYAAHLGVDHDPQEALTWATQRGARSGRVAWHFAVEIAGRAGRRL
jgi:uncharacterized protein